MPKDERSKKGAPSRPRTNGDGNAISDPRFKNFETDPRFRLPGRKDRRVTIDKRFGRMLKDEEFAAKASVDKYGRKLPKGAETAKLRQKFEVEEGSEGDSDDESELDGDEDGVDNDNDVAAELARVSATYDPARDGGFDESSSDEESSSEEEEDESEDETSYREVEEAALKEQAEGAGVDAEMPLEEVSARLAAVNLDWDNVRAVDLLAVAASFVPDGGKIESVQIFPSEFGKQRMEREEMEGPPKELFVSSRKANAQTETEQDGTEDESDEDDEAIKARLLAQSTSEEANTEVNSSALRKYQLTRLRYYYAIMTCDSSDTALTLYRNMDGREYLSSANFFDLRFIPDDVDFADDVPRDECSEIPSGYKPNDFVTEALTHSKVKLTWDEEEAKTRKEAQKRAFKAGDADEQDLRAYLASSSSEDDGSDEEAAQSGKQSRADAARAKLRAALGLSTAGDLDAKSQNGTNDRSQKKKKDAAPVGDMQITFTAGLGGHKTQADDESDHDQTVNKQKPKNSVFVNRPEDVREETTRERYIRKEKERKARRKERARARQLGEATDETKTTHHNTTPDTNGHEPNEDDPFADDFFADPAAANEKLKKEAKKAKRDSAREKDAKEAERKAKEREELELLMAEDGERGSATNGHFDMTSIKKAEKIKKTKKGKRGKKAKGEDEEEVPGADFDIDVQDPRFSSLYDSHDFAIDPSNPRFSGTNAMKKVLEEGRKRRRDQRGDADDGDVVQRNSSKTAPEARKRNDVDELVQRVKKRKMAKPS